MPPPTDSPDDPSVLAPGSMLGAYRIDREIGRGGMATVYLAHDTRLDRAVAIKVLDPAISHAVGAQRFGREIQIAAHLSHPHILPLFETGEIASVRFYVTPYVPESSVRDLLTRRGRLDVGEAVSITREVASALDYAHRAGVTHRDIKPENILIADGVPVVADFGLAVLTADHSAKLTQTGVLVGTPQYMSPEQLDGSAAVDGRTDQYSLACVLYEMIAGRPAFRGATIQHLITAHLLAPLDFVDQLENAPAGIRAAIRRALAKNPADRYPTVRQFADALGEAAPTAAIRPWWHWPAVGLAAAAALIAVWLVASRSSDDAVQRTDTPRWAVVAFSDATGDQNVSGLAQRLDESVLRNLQRAPGLDVVSVPAGGRDPAATHVISGALASAGDTRAVSVRLTSAAGALISSAELPVGNSAAQRDSLVQRVNQFVAGAMRREMSLTRLRRGNTSAEAWGLFHRALTWLDTTTVVTDDAVASPGARLDSADALLARAERLDRAWGTPTVRRVRLVLERSPMNEGIAFGQLMDTCIARVDSVLQRNTDHSDALALRGYLALRRWAGIRDVRLDVSTDTTALVEAEGYLRRATNLEPRHPDAWLWLSRLYPYRQDFARAALAAERAYEADPLAREAPALMSRLALTYYDTQSWVESWRWCNDGRSRFPDDFRFTRCRLHLLAAPTGAPPHPDSVWTAYADMGRVARSPSSYYAHEAALLVAGGLARAGLRDSAERVLRRARAQYPSASRAELIGYEAMVRETALNDRDGALQLLAEYLVAFPGHRAGLARSPNWWWASMRSDPRFKQLVGIK